MKRFQGRTSTLHDISRMHHRVRDFNRPATRQAKPSMTDLTDYHHGVVAKIEEVAHEKMLFAHCIIHLEHLAAKKLILKMCYITRWKLSMKFEVNPWTPEWMYCVKVWIRSMSVFSILQKDPCPEGNEFFLLFLELKKETKQFLRERNSQSAEFLLHVMRVSMRIWRIYFAIWTSLILGFCTIIFVLKSKDEAFKTMLVLWDGCVQKGDLDHIDVYDFKRFFDKCWCQCWRVTWHCHIFWTIRHTGL